MSDIEREEYLHFMNTYMDERDFTKRQKRYLNVICNAFNMKSARGNISPYSPEPYQIEYHADCMIANPDAENRIWEKARGVGATATTMIDALMVGHRYNDVNIPVASITGTQSNGPIDWAIWLVDNLQLPGFLKRDERINSQCILDNGSTIFPVPGHNPEALRSFRTVFNIYDEFAFHQYPKKLKAAGDACLSEGGQINILSTLNGTENDFWYILSNASDFGYKVYQVPMFDPNVFDVNRPIPDQMAEGLITPIAPWVDIANLERSRKYDKIAFMQEQMCSPEDGAVSFLSSQLLHEISRSPEQIEQYGRIGFNPYICGIDFASERDTSAFQVYEVTPYGYIHRNRYPVRRTDTVAQNKLLRQLHERFDFQYITIDMTGPGTGFYHYAKDQLGSKRVIGINFSSRVNVNKEEEEKYRRKDINERKDGKITVPVKRAMATHMRLEAEKGRMIILDYKDYLADMHSVPYETLDAPRSKDGAHGDEFWGTALALWGYHKNTTMHAYMPPMTMRY